MKCCPGEKDHGGYQVPASLLGALQHCAKQRLVWSEEHPCPTARQRFGPYTQNSLVLSLQSKIPVIFLFFSVKMQRLRLMTQIVRDSKELLMEGEPACSPHRWYHLIMGLKRDLNMCVTSDTLARSFCSWLNFTWNCKWKNIKFFLDKEMEAVSGCVLLVVRAQYLPCPLPRDLIGDLVRMSGYNEHYSHVHISVFWSHTNYCAVTVDGKIVRA